MPPPRPLDPHSAYPVTPEGPIPRAAREPTGAARAGLAILGVVLAAGAIVWLVVIVLQLVDFLSADCKLLGCAAHTGSEHVRTYSEALIGVTGAVFAARASYRSFRLIHAHGHMVSLRRAVIAALTLLVIWSVLMGLS